jgi:hypothetical protein
MLRVTERQFTARRGYNVVDYRDKLLSHIESLDDCVQTVSA